MSHFEKTLDYRMLYEGRVFQARIDTVELEDKSTTTREVVEHSGGVAVVALDEKGNVLLVTQYRYGAKQELIEIPAGKLEPGEDHSVCGLRELEEETGYTAKTYRYLGSLIPTPAYCSEVIHLYYAADLSPTAQNLDVDEFLSVSRMPLEQAVSRVLDNTITDSKTQIGLLRVWALKQRGEL